MTGDRSARSFQWDCLSAAPPTSPPTTLKLRRIGRNKRLQRLRRWVARRRRRLRRFAARLGRVLAWKILKRSVKQVQDKVQDDKQDDGNGFPLEFTPYCDTGRE